MPENKLLKFTVVKNSVNSRFIPSVISSSLLYLDVNTSTSKEMLSSKLVKDSVKQFSNIY